MYHPGFASAWLSKSTTDDLESYAGDGDWFKILSVTGRTEQSLDYSDPEWAPYYDVFKSVWGTYRVSSVSDSPIACFTLRLMIDVVELHDSRHDTIRKISSSF